MKPLVDRIIPKSKVQILLKRKGKTEAGIYLEGEKEFRSPSLKRSPDDTKKSNRSR
jgi:hypothetical protein